MPKIQSSENIAGLDTQSETFDPDAVRRLLRAIEDDWWKVEILKAAEAVRASEKIRPRPVSDDYLEALANAGARPALIRGLWEEKRGR